MTSELVVITPGLSPGSGGVADHTLALLREWPADLKLTLLMMDQAAAAREYAAQVRQLGPNRDDILAQLPPQGGKVFVQYSAYGFNRFGYPRDLIAALIRWKKRSGGYLAVMFHEIWAFWPVTNKNFLIQQLHRRALRRLLEVCDAVFTTTGSQAEHLRRLDNASVQVVPAGSNVASRPVSLQSKRNQTWGVIFGLQTSRVRALENMRQSLDTLSKSGRLSRIIAIGAGSDADAAAREHQLLNDLHLIDGFAQEGALSSDAVSARMSSVAFGIFGQTEFSCTKSGSFMAYAAHQLSVIADFAHPGKPPPICWLVSPAELLGGIDTAELDRRAECLRMWQEQKFSWNVIATKIGRALVIEARQPSVAAEPIS